MSRKSKTVQMDKVCRICMMQSKMLKPLFNTRLSEMLTACASVSVFENDGLPQRICNHCSSQLNQFYKFRKKIERSDASLRLQLKEQKMANIITQAANDADIELTPSNFKKDNAKESEQINSLNETASSDSSCTVIISNKAKTLSRESKDKANKLIQSVVKNESNYSDYINEEIILENSKLDIEYPVVDNLPTIFTDSPPPLVPLANVPVPLAKIDTVTELQNSAILESSDILPLKPLIPEAPPLVPLNNSNEIAVLTGIDEHTQDIAVHCSICNEIFSNYVELKSHMSEHITGNKLVCNICKKEFQDKKRLIGHLKGHTVVKQYACKMCGKRYPNPSTFKVHMRTHTGERPFKCKICDKGFVRWAGVMGHMKSHNTYAPYKCNICQKGFKISSNLERHKNLHTGAMPFCCSYCGKTFNQSDNLLMHVRTYHTMERPYLCSQCGKGFVSSSRLKRHTWVHTGYKPHVCKLCGKKYSNSNDLKNHSRIHKDGGPSDSDKPLACSQCNMRFFHQCRLAKHMKIHEKPYACNDCSKTFSKQNVLNKHVITKHNEDHLQLYKIGDLYLENEFQ